MPSVTAGAVPPDSRGPLDLARLALGLAAPLAPDSPPDLRFISLALPNRTPAKSSWRPIVDAVRLAAGLFCLLLIAMALCYAMLCAASPFGRCRRCAGKGYVGTALRSRGRSCRRCDSTGIRIRLGRHLYNEITRTRRGGVR